MTFVCKRCGRDFDDRGYPYREQQLFVCPSCQRAEDEREQRAAEAYDDPDPIIDERSYP